MANVSHAALTGSNLHEPKGVAEASANTVYRADGAGSGDWEAPLNLIERRALSGLAAEEFTGLSTYRSLWLVVEGWTWSATSTIPIIQFGTSGAYRTSGYLTSVLNNTTDLLNVTTAGAMITHTLSVDDGFANVQIMNFNSSTHPTSAQSESVQCSVNLIGSASSPGTYYRYDCTSIYPTVEAHEKIKVTTTGGTATCSGGYLTLYGIQ